MKMFEVGGCVRDELLGVKSKDVDFAVVLDPDELFVGGTDFWPEPMNPFGVMVRRLRAMGFEIFLETPEFLTIRARFPKGTKNANLTADFVLARKESDYTDGRRPDRVEPGTLIDDLARRDFTMNAVAKDDSGTLIDPFGGVEDIRRRVIRAVGDPYDRFEEDALRIMRALRFLVTKGFTIDYGTAVAMEDNLHRLSTVSAERMREELTKMFNHDPRQTIAILNNWKLFNMIFDMGINFRPTMKERIR